MCMIEWNYTYFRVNEKLPLGICFKTLRFKAEKVAPYRFSAKSLNCGENVYFFHEKVISGTKWDSKRQ